MALVSNAIFTDPEFVWDALCVAPDDRVKHAALMESWINGMTAFFEQWLNRPVIERIVGEQLDGNGLGMIYTRKSPASDLTSLRVYYSDFRNFDDIDVDQTNDATKEVDFFENGRIVLLAEAPITRFWHGAQNVVVSYTAGLPAAELELVRAAAIEMIATRWGELGRNPLERVRSDSIVTLSTFTKGRFDELPFMTKQVVGMLRRRQV